MERIAATARPLAGFLFSRDQSTIDRFVGELSYGGGAVNQVNIHLFREYAVRLTHHQHLTRDGREYIPRIPFCRSIRTSAEIRGSSSIMIGAPNDIPVTVYFALTNRGAVKIRISVV
jgi:hypothetical protein